MNKAETLQDFYKSIYNKLPDNFNKEIGHFNVFKLKSNKNNTKPVPYTRRDYFKIGLFIGKCKIEYHDKIHEIKKQGIVFSNPSTPYRWENEEKKYHGFYCIFDWAFYPQHEHIIKYPVFQQGSNYIYELTNMQTKSLVQIFQRMLDEINSDYIYKYDILRNLVYEIIHFVLKMQPIVLINKQKISASQRITALFLEQLKRQYSIGDNRQASTLRFPSEYATQLNVHVNYLNRVVKEITGRTTSQIIAERVLQEAKILLKQTDWTTSEIAYALGFAEVTHFNNFFKKHLQINPTQFRKV